MSLYLRRQIMLKGSDSSGMGNPIIQRGDRFTQISAIAELAEAVGGSLVVPAPQTDMVLPFPPGATTGRMFYIESDLEITLKFNGVEADRGLVIKPPSSTISAVVLLDIEFTSVYLTLGGTTSANIYYAIIGA
jgi:hypothetical protein